MVSRSLKRGGRRRTPWRLLAGAGVLVLTSASACSSDSPCDSDDCAQSAAGALGAGAPGSAGAAGAAEEMSPGGARGNAATDTFGGEAPLAGDFDAGGAPCKPLYLPLLVSRSFVPLGASPDCGERVPYAAGDCFVLEWQRGNLEPVRWQTTGASRYCLEDGAVRVRFQARVDDDETLVNFFVAPGIETGPLRVKRDWAQYELVLNTLNYGRFDFFSESSEPPGLVAFAAAPLRATRLYVDDVRWLRAAPAEGDAP
jgi:hypothetical protein